jgi:AraC-like DNA-binding protein
MGQNNWNCSSIMGKNATIVASDYLMWPVDARTGVHVAGLFPLTARGFDFAYRAPTHAIHLHEYVGVIRLEGQDHALKPGTLTISPAQRESRYDLPRPGVHWCIHFDPQPPETGTPCLHLPLVKHLGPAQGDAAKRFAQIARLQTMRTHAEGEAVVVLREAVATALQELVVWFAFLEPSDSPNPSRRRNLRMQRLFDYVDRNLGRTLRAAELARAAGLSQNHLARSFRLQVGCALPRYVLKRRIGLARLLLETTDLPVKQIAIRVGMPDPHHFNKQFRALAGVSPRAYRTGAGPAEALRGS